MEVAWLKFRLQRDSELAATKNQELKAVYDESTASAAKFDSMERSYNAVTRTVRH